MSLVSVIVPCYNADSYIERCLQGLEAQKYRDFDVVLIDDCSTDATAEVIRQYSLKSDLRLLYYRNERNIGPAGSRKKGVEVSETKYIAFCDCDDWYEPNYLHMMIQKANENDADMVFCAYQTVFLSKAQHKVIQHKLEHIPNELHTKEALELNIDSLSVTLVKREILNNVPILDIRNGEDMAIIPLMIANSKKFGVVNECLYNYLCREGSASMQTNAKVVEALISSFEHIYRNMPKEYSKETEIIGVRNLIYGGLLTLFKYSFDIIKARDILMNFESYYPNWRENPNIRLLPFYKKIFIKFAGNRQFVCLKILSMIHLILTRN